MKSVFLKRPEALKCTISHKGSRNTSKALWLLFSGCLSGSFFLQVCPFKFILGLFHLQKKDEIGGLWQVGLSPPKNQ
jgi:hypothetical protein